METLHDKLKATHLKRVSDSVWGASGAAQYILQQFRNRVKEGTLGLSDGTTPHYVFDPYQIQPPAGATFEIASWERYQDYVLDVIRSSTGMTVTWPGPGLPIELHMSGACSREPDGSPAGVLLFVDDGSSGLLGSDGGPFGNGLLGAPFLTNAMNALSASPVGSPECNKIPPSAGSCHQTPSAKPQKGGRKQRAPGGEFGGSLRINGRFDITVAYKQHEPGLGKIGAGGTNAAAVSENKPNVAASGIPAAAPPPGACCVPRSDRPDNVVVESPAVVGGPPASLPETSPPAASLPAASPPEASLPAVGDSAPAAKSQ